MLSQITIKNVALIDCAEINFTDGLNVLSGETGAGKSVIIESLNFVLGAKADKTLIRSGQTECMVKAEFDVCNNENIINIYDEFDFEREDVLIISRKFTIDGKSSVKINGNTATLSMLKKFTSVLVDVHGQSEHFTLLKTSKQLELIDKLAGHELDSIKNNLSVEYAKYKQILKTIDELGGDEHSRLIRLDVLNYQINEIQSADLQDGEEEFLIEAKQKLNNQEKIITTLSTIKSAISDEGGVEDIVSNATRISSGITSYGDNYSVLYDRLYNVFSELSDISDTVNSYIDDLETPEYDFNYVEQRLELIKALKSKYGNNIEKIYEFLSNAIIEKEKLENYNQTADKLVVEKSKCQQVLYSLYNELSNIRRKHSKILEDNILSELTELGMSKARFCINFSKIDDIDNCKFNSANGIDEIEFLFSANSGEPLKPLSSVISGGEMSRFMLAIKAQTAKYKDVSTFIFDEIDSGISGNVAKTVSEKFAKIAKDVQIIAITHLPQISSMADNNLLITKSEKENKTLTNVKKLSKEDKVYEIVRLIGGEKDSETAINHAKDLISTANNFKSNIKNQPN